MHVSAVGIFYRKSEDIEAQIVHFVERNVDAFEPRSVLPFPDSGTG